MQFTIKGFELILNLTFLSDLRFIFFLHGYHIHFFISIYRLLLRLSLSAMSPVLVKHFFKTQELAMSAINQEVT